MRGKEGRMAKRMMRNKIARTLKISRMAKGNPSSKMKMKRVDKRKNRSRHLRLLPRQSRIRASQKHNPNNPSHQNPILKSPNNKSNAKTSENDLTMILQ